MFLKIKGSLTAACFLNVISGCTAQRYYDSDLAGAIVGSILCTLIVCCLIAFAFYWMYVRPRDGKLQIRFEDATQPDYRVGGPTCTAGIATQSRSLERENETIAHGKKRANGHAQSTYVNAAFHDNDLLVQPGYKSTHHYQAVGRLKKPLPATVRTQSTMRRRSSFGDKYHQKEDAEHIKVKLRGHDFTGLGFNICGNLRDGIYVQNVLQKGPAADSGVLEPGDRIMDVRVSFKNIVFEDALTILSYASPYDVTLSVKKDDVSRTGRHPSSDQTTRRSLQPHMDHARSANERIYFPLKRSQSNGDLDAISRRSSTATPPPEEGSPVRVRRDRQVSADERLRAQRRLAEEAHGYASINSIHRTSPTSSIRHVLTTPSVSGRDVRRQIDREISIPQETTKETTEETISFRKADSNLKKKAAPPVPPPPPHSHPLHQIHDEDDDDDESFPPPPRPFSSVSESSTSSSGSRSRRAESHHEESRSVGASSMLTEILQEFEQDRSRKRDDQLTRPPPLPPKLPPREYQTFEMIWTEGSESETSSVYDKQSERGMASRKDSGFPLTEHTYIRQPYTAQSDRNHDISISHPRSPHVVQTPSGGTRLILPINMDPSPSASTPTSFTSDEEDRTRSGRQSRISYGEVRKPDGKESPTKRPPGTASPNFR